MIGDHIELFGLPGAGKSTLLARLRDAGQRPGAFGLDVQRHDSEPRGPTVIAGTLGLLTKSFRHAPVEVSRFLSWSGAWWLPLKLAFRQKSLAGRRHGYEGITEDGGVLQPFVSFAAEHNRPARSVPVLPLLAAVGRPRLAVYVCATPRVAHQRYMERQSTLGIPLDAEICRQRFVAAEQVCQDVVAACATLGTPVVNVNVDRWLDDRALLHLANRLTMALQSETT